VLSIRRAQIDRLSSRAREAFEDQLAHALVELWPEEAARLGEEGFRRRVLLEIQRARARRLSLKHDVARFASLGLLWRLPLHGDASWPEDLTVPPNVSGEDHVRLLVALTRATLAGRIAAASRSQLRTLLAAWRRSEGPARFPRVPLDRVAASAGAASPAAAANRDGLGNPEPCRIEGFELCVQEPDGARSVRVVALDRGLAGRIGRAPEDLLESGSTVELVAMPRRARSSDEPTWVEVRVLAESPCLDRAHPHLLLERLDGEMPASHHLFAASRAFRFPVFAPPEFEGAPPSSGPALYRIAATACRLPPALAGQAPLELSCTLAVVAPRDRATVAPSGPGGRAPGSDLADDARALLRAGTRRRGELEAEHTALATRLEALRPALARREGALAALVERAERTGRLIEEARSLPDALAREQAALEAELSASALLEGSRSTELGGATTRLRRAGGKDPRLVELVEKKRLEVGQIRTERATLSARLEGVRAKRALATRDPAEEVRALEQIEAERRSLEEELDRERAAVAEVSGRLERITRLEAEIGPLLADLARSLEGWPASGRDPPPPGPLLTLRAEHGARLETLAAARLEAETAARRIDSALAALELDLGTGEALVGAALLAALPAAFDLSPSPAALEERRRLAEEEAGRARLALEAAEAEVAAARSDQLERARVVLAPAVAALRSLLENPTDALSSRASAP
jgi:hypothetical protein